ncbi:MAG: CCA tRNA nucleotidyltransferase [Candidatus Dormiibacterota bacterium]
MSSPESAPEPELTGEVPTGAALRRLLPELEAGVGTKVCIVGGFVRDLLLGRPADTDIDIVVEGGSAEAAAEWLRRRWDRRARVVSFERFGTAQIAFASPVVGRLTLEFVRARAEAYSPDSRKPEVRAGTLEEDAERRDFTINALLLDSRGEVLDPTGQGLEDLRLGVLRTPLPPLETFSEDPLRMLRAARFVSQLEFELAPGVEEAMAAMAARLAIVSPERIRDELIKLLLAARPSLGLRILNRTGLLAQFLPEVAAMTGIDQAGYHLGDVFQHTCLSLDAAAPRRIVRLAVLFHDVGKPVTAAAGPDGPTFLGHPQAGATIAATAMERLRFSGAEIEAVRQLVQLHMRPIQYSSQWADSAVRRLWHAAGELLPDLMALARADTQGSSFPGLDQLLELEDRMATVAVEHPQGIRSPLDGEQLKGIFGLPAGPWVGRAQKLLIEAVMEGELQPTDQSDAEGAAAGYLRQRQENWRPQPGEPGA